jgi:adenylate cyclase
VERRLTSILAADVAGFSRLVARDEEGTLRTLAVYRSAIADFVAEHGGRIANTAGDGLIIEFPSPVQAVRCAVAIQRSLFRRNEDLPDERKLEFRIGLNLGDVVAAGDDLLGDAVNVAARLQEIAAPGGICISDTVHRHLEGKATFPLARLGERTLKNIPRPVTVYKVDWQAEDPADSGVLAGAPSLPDKPSIAVLPFVNMGGDPDQDYFADGITEDIITALSRYRWFFVIARNSSFAYKGRSVDVRQVARELGVRYVLEGSVRKAGGRLRVTGQLIDAESGAHLWAERYDRASEDVFAIQDELTEHVVGAIEPEMLMREGSRQLQADKANPDAFDCVLRGIWHHYQATREHYNKAEQWLRRAIDIDPHYARGYMALARMLYGRCIFGWSADVLGDRSQIVTLAERAVALDEHDPYCQYSLFAARLLQGRLQETLAVAQRIIDLNPNFALGHLALGGVRIYLGHFEEALVPLLRTIRLSPNDPISFHFNNQLALAHFHLGNFQEALHFAQRGLDSRRLYVGLTIACASLVRLDRTDEARALAQEMQRNEPDDLAGYWATVHPYADPAHREQFLSALRLAGLQV